MSESRNTGANSLLENLRKFRFNKKSLLGDENASSTSEGLESPDVKENDEKSVPNVKDAFVSKGSPVKVEKSLEEDECTPTPSGNCVNGTQSGQFFSEIYC